MYTTEALQDLHRRAHRSLSGLLAHCRSLGRAELDRELAGFGYPTARLQLHHIIGAEEYWVGVLRGSFRAEDDAHEYPTIDSLESYRERVHSATTAYLGGASPEELNGRRSMVTFGGRARMLVPGHVILRTQTHIYHHHGQVAAMCRLLGRPVPAGLDFPLD